jgi:hypothetical protein
MEKPFIFDPDNCEKHDISLIDLIEELAEAEHLPQMSLVAAMFLADLFDEMDTEKLVLGFDKVTVEFRRTEEGASLIVKDEVTIQ